MADSLPWLKRRLLPHWEMKLVALLLAVITWYAVRDVISFTREIRDVKVDIQAKEEMAILHQSAAGVDVSFRGSQDDIERLDPKRIRAVVDLSTHGSSAMKLITLTPENIDGIRGGVSVEAITPHQIMVTLDREEEKRVPVKGRAAGHLLAGEVEEILCEPATVLVRGPARRLKDVEMVYAQPVDLEGRSTSFAKLMAVLAPSENWKARIVPQEVLVRVRLLERSVRKDWVDVPVAVLQRPSAVRKIQVEPMQVKVWALGSAEELKELIPDSIRVFVDATGLPDGSSGDLTVQVHVTHRKPGITTAVEPATVRVTVQP